MQKIEKRLEIMELRQRMHEKKMEIAELNKEQKRQAQLAKA